MCITAVISALKRLRQRDCCKFEAYMIYIGSCGPKPCLQKNWKEGWMGEVRRKERGVEAGHCGASLVYRASVKKRERGKREYE